MNEEIAMKKIEKYFYEQQQKRKAQQFLIALLFLTSFTFYLLIT